MSLRDLKAKYGRSLKDQAAVNAAIRAELPGGAALVDALAGVYHFLRQHPDDANVRHAQALLRKTREQFAGQIAQLYDLGAPSDE